MICLWITFYGGEGVRSVGENCGYIRYTEKTKIGKGATPPLPHYEKKGVGGWIRTSDSSTVLCCNSTQHRQKSAHDSTNWVTPTRVWTVALPRELPKSIHTLVGVGGFHEAGYGHAKAHEKPNGAKPLSTNTINLPYQHTICYIRNLSRPQRQG